MAAANPALPTVTVTHHPEEIPPTATHVLLLADGRVTAAGPIETTLTGAALSECLGVEVEVARNGRRWAAMIAG